MIYIYNEKNKGDNVLKKGYSSLSAEKMSIEELEKLVGKK